MSTTPPLRSQRVGFPGYLSPDDGQPDENPNENCGWAVYSAAIEALTGITVSPDHLKDHNPFYGQGSTGPSWDGNYQFEDQTYGLTLTLRRLTGDARAADIRAAVNSGQYVQVLIPSDWDDAAPNSTSSHYVLIYSDDGTGLWAENPWAGTYMHRDYARWALLDARGGDYLIYSKAGAPAMTGIPNTWTKDATTGFLHAPRTTHVVRHAFAAHIEAAGADGWNGNLIPLDDEHYDPAGQTRTVRQTFAMALEYDGQTNTVGEEYGPMLADELAAAHAANAALTQQLTDAKTALATTDNDLALAESVNADLKEELAAAQQQLSALRGQLAQAKAAVSALLAVVPLLRAALAAANILK